MGSEVEVGLEGRPVPDSVEPVSLVFDGGAEGVADDCVPVDADIPSVELPGGAVGGVPVAGVVEWIADVLMVKLDFVASPDVPFFVGSSPSPLVPVPVNGVAVVLGLGGVELPLLLLPGFSVVVVEGLPVVFRSYSWVGTVVGTEASV